MWIGVTISVLFAPSSSFSREAGHIAGNQPMSIKQANKKLVSGLLIQIILHKVLQECTTILELKL